MSYKRCWIAGLVLILGLTACQPLATQTIVAPATSQQPGQQPSQTAATPADATPTILALPPTAAPPTPTLTPQPPRLLTICTGREPESLFIYSAGNAAARPILEAVYDGPYDIRGYTETPVILTQQPTLENGALRLEAATVAPGQPVVDLAGNLTYLEAGVSYRPSGCNAVGCAVTYSGSEAVSIDQQVVRYSLLPGLRWSDGALLTAADVLYSYHVASALAGTVKAERLAHTASYQALDETTIEWRGVPGLVDSRLSLYFFTPLPEHAWGTLAPADLMTAEAVNRQPLGWGPYVIEQWTAGDHITLHRNANYFRAGEGLPYFDNLVFRFVADGKAALEALQTGECDLADNTALLELELPSLLQLQAAGQLALFFRPGTAWELIAFDLQPVDGSASLFAQPAVRQAMAQCINRQALVDRLLFGQSVVMDSYLPPTHPLYNGGTARYAYDPQAGADKLEAAGWKDLDSNPATPRTAQGVAGLADGTALTFSYLVGDDAERQAAAGMIQADLAQCGVGMTLDVRPFQEYLAAGPEGPVFGRSFQAAQFAWPSSAAPTCYLFTSDEIPGPYPEYPHAWGGVNASGYSRLEFDEACRSAQASLPGQPGYTAAQAQAQAIFAEDLPAIPLYARIKLYAARPDLCGLETGFGATSNLWGLEGLNYGDNCQNEMGIKSLTFSEFMGIFGPSHVDHRSSVSLLLWGPKIEKGGESAEAD